MEKSKYHLSVANHVDMLIDTGSYLLSNYAFQFNQDSLKKTLEQTFDRKATKKWS